MNKDDIKQIIFEEIEAAISEMASPEELAADSRPEDEDFSLEDEMEMARDFNDEQDAIFGKPNFVEEEGLEEMARTSNVFKLSQEASMKDVLQFMQRVNDVLKTYKSPGQKRPKKRFTPEEMKALATAMLNPEGFTSKDVIASTSYNSPAQANKFLKALEMKGLITLTSQLKKSMTPDRDPNAPETRGRKRKGAEFDMADDPTGMDFGDFEDLDLSDPLAERVVMNPRFFDGVRIGDRPESETERNNRLDQEKRKKELEALKKDNAAKAAARAKASAEEKAKRDAIVKMGAKVKDKFGNEFVVAHLNSPFSVRVRDPKTKRFVQKTPRKLGDIGVGLDQGGIDYPDKWQYGTSFQHDELTLTENNNTMSELEKYIKQQIKEAKNPLAKKMKEIETQGRIAALETKLAAVAEMIEETEGRLTRIDEDNEFKEMMDKNAVKEVRKQLKELERAQGKLQKEYDKLSSGRKQEKVVDEVDADKLRDLADRQDALDQEAGEVEEVSFELNESVKRMQKLANLKG